MAEPTATNSDRIRFFLNDDDHYMVGDFDGDDLDEWLAANYPYTADRP